MRRGLLWLIVCAALAYLPPSASAQSAVSWVAFVMPLAQGGGEGLFIVDVDRPDERHLLAVCAVLCEGIAWGADGDSIGYMDGDQLLVVGVDAVPRAQVAIDRGTYPYNVRPSWTPDLSRVAFDARYNARNWLVLVDMRDGTTDVLDVAGVRPVWLANGNIGYTAGGRTHTLNLTTGTTQALTPRGDYHDLPSWSPDGAQVAMRVWLGGEDYALAVMSADGSAGRVLMTGIVERPVWSPDGTHLATIQWNNLQGSRATAYVINVATGALTALRPRPDFTGLSPVWAGPDRVVYVGRWMPYTPTLDLILHDIRTGRRVRLARGVGQVGRPVAQVAVSR